MLRGNVNFYSVYTVQKRREHPTTTIGEHDYHHVSLHTLAKEYPSENGE